MPELGGVAKSAREYVAHPRINWVLSFRIACVLLTACSLPAVGQTLATYQFTGGWATFGLALPQGAAVSGVRVGSLETQTDVKTLWPDGSIRFAIVTAKIGSSGSYPILASTKPTAGATPSWPRAAVTLDIAGTIWTAALPATSTDSWLVGPLVHEARAVVAPTTGGSSHPFLRVVYDVRTYADGNRRVDVAVQSTLDVAVADRVTYNVAITVDGTTVFNQSAVEHPYMMRWRKVFNRGLIESVVTPDLSTFYSARAFPRYMTEVPSTSYDVSSSRFNILGPGDVNRRMGDAGGRPEIAPYPDWDAVYFIHRTASKRNYVLRHGDLAGSWSVHLTESDGVSPISIDTHPGIWFIENPNVTVANRLAGIGFGEYDQKADNAHAPSLAYVPYLLTGDRYYADEMAYWANFVLIWQPPDARGGGGKNGLLLNDQTRGIAWGLRNLVDAAAWLPDANPYRAYFAEKVANNLRWFDSYAQEHQTPLESTFEDGASAEYAMMAPWQNDYMAWSVQHANEQGFVGGLTLLPKLLRFRVRLFSDPAWPRTEATPYWLPMGDKVAGNVTWYPDLATVHAKAVQAFGLADTGVLGVYAVEARVALLIGVDRGTPNAAAALQFVVSQSEVMRAVLARSGWALGGTGAPSPIGDLNGPINSPANLHIIR